MIAGLASDISNALAGSGMTLQSPITDFTTFEQLAFKGRGRKDLTAFLHTVTHMAKERQVST